MLFCSPPKWLLRELPPAVPLTFSLFSILSPRGVRYDLKLAATDFELVLSFPKALTSGFGEVGVQVSCEFSLLATDDVDPAFPRVSMASSLISFSD